MVLQGLPVPEECVANLFREGVDLRSVLGLAQTSGGLESGRIDLLGLFGENPAGHYWISPARTAASRPHLWPLPAAQPSRSFSRCAWEEAAEEYGRLLLDWVSGGYRASRQANPGPGALLSPDDH